MPEFFFRRLSHGDGTEGYGEQGAGKELFHMGTI
jgi:hypothetical protein